MHTTTIAHHSHRAQIAAVLRTLPELTHFGMGIYHERGAALSPVEYVEQFRAKQAQLLTAGATFAQVCQWLEQIAPCTAMTCGSYYVKHVCEQAIREYVSNGTLIAAAIHCGFPYRVVPGSPNIRLGMSKRSLSVASQRVKRRP